MKYFKFQRWSKPSVKYQSSKDFFLIKIIKNKKKSNFKKEKKN